jgi:hypothetical protein
MVLLSTDVSEEAIASISRVIRISNLRLLATANIVSGTLILITLMMGAISSSLTSLLTRATRRHIPDDGNLHVYLLENLKSYVALTGWALAET